MSDTEEEEENYCFYGKPLDPYDEDAFPKKRPISVEEQIATDAHGRRRFHGAFTGGFSAGFFNTVGSLEGWTPSEFKSSRGERAHSKLQKPEDFMDDEDIGEFGFAPETVKATKDFSTVTKRKRQIVTEGPIPGEPVLETLISSGDETIGYLLLKNIGLQDKINLKKQISSGEKTYGCEMPSSYELNTISSVLEEDSYKIPEIYRKYIEKPKNDTFGLGYSGLDKSHQNLFKSTNFVVHDKNKKLSVSGQAFGVGAFEEDDEDIYAKEDMTRYDFELTKEKEVPKSEVQNQKQIFGMFVLSKNPVQNNVRFPPPTIPQSFTGKHKLKKSRFEPLKEEKEEDVPRQSIDPSIRAKYLGEETVETHTSSKEIKTSFSKKGNKEKLDEKNQKQSENISTNKTERKATTFNPDLIFDKFVSASQPDDHTNLLEPVKPSQSEHGTQEMRDAARMKMFGPLTRIILDWKPCALLCKRFNVPEPSFDGSQMSKRKRTKHLIFEYQQHSEENSFYKPGLTVPKDERASTSAEVAEEVDVSSKASSANVILDTLEACSTSSKASSANVILDTLEACSTSQLSHEVTAKETDNMEMEIATTEDSSEDNKPKELTDRLNIEENIDLFKAVFLSSSESEDEDNKVEQPKTEITEEMKTNVLSDQFIPKIKPVKEGILSNIDYIKFTKPVQQPQKETEVETNKKDMSAEMEINKDKSNVHEELRVNESLYGPKLPEKLQTITPKTAVKIDSPPSSEDDWVEKGKEHKKKKKKHKKKHKKDKHKKTKDKG